MFDYSGTYAGDVRFTASCVAGTCVPSPPAPPHPAPERSVACEPEPTDTFPFLGTRVACAIGVGGDTDVYRFDAREGDRILAEVVKMGGHASFLPRIQLIAPDGAQVALAQSPAWAHLSLTQTGVYTAIVFDYSGTYDGDYVFTVSCTGGPCLSLRSVPTVSLTLTGCTVCAPGNVLQVEAHWQNLGPSRVAEVKLGVRAPDGTPYNLIGDKHLEYMFLPGFDLTGTFISLPWPSGLPAGQWTVEATLIGPDLGDTFSRDVKVFTATP